MYRNPPGWVSPPVGRPRPDAPPVTACLNGSRTRRDHPGVPLDPLSIAEAARAVVAAGAQLIHVHPRDRHGSESLAGVDVARTVQAGRARPSHPSAALSAARSPTSPSG